MNVNDAPPISVGLVSYMPRIEVPDSCSDKQAYEDAQHYLLQKCVGLILSCIEDRSRHGFRCLIGGRELHCFPRLGAMTLDTVERAKYFCQRNYRSCGHCILRYGRSITRRSTRQDNDLLHVMWGWALKDAHSQITISQRAKAKKKLHRHGWKFDRRCHLHDYVKDCLVYIPRYGNLPFAGLIQYERMHVFFINYCNYCMELLVACVDPANYYRASKFVKACHQFRDPFTGKVHPRLHSVLKMSHLTAERRVRAIFYWAHVLGTKAEIAVTEMRTCCQIAVSSLQLLLIATRGHRSYSERELDVIFLGVGRQFFQSLEQMSTYAEKVRLTKGRKAHERQPTRCREPVPFKRTKRCVVPATCRIFVPHVEYLSHTCRMFVPHVEYLSHV